MELDAEASRPCTVVRRRFRRLPEVDKRKVLAMDLLFNRWVRREARRTISRSSMPSRGSHCQIECLPLPADAPQTELRRLAGSVLLVLKRIRVTERQEPGMTSIDIRLGQTYVGEWSFDQSPQQLVAAQRRMDLG